MVTHPTISPPSQDIAAVVRAEINGHEEIALRDPTRTRAGLFWVGCMDELPDQNHFGDREFYTPVREQDNKAEAFLQRLEIAAENPQGHLQRLEEVFSSLTEWYGGHRIHSLDELFDNTMLTLRRLPDLPTELPDCGTGLMSDLALGYFQDSSGSRSWANLKVVQLLQRNLIRCAAHIDLENRLSITPTGPALGEVSRLIYLSTRKERMQQNDTSDRDGSRRHARFVVRAYLWCFWQRCLLLHLLSKVREILSIGAEDYGPMDEAGDFPVAPDGTTLMTLTKQAARREKPIGFCGWAFELLSSDPNCNGLSFSVLFERFEEVWAAHPLDCRSGGVGACEGRNWRLCRRFAGNRPANQTMHEDGCPFANNPVSETRIPWDEDSYRQVQASSPSTGVAVSIPKSAQPGLPSKLRYCPASKHTMAISHVWSHGQGGRPHEGINQCLHDRYIRLAKDLGFESYWIDSACIPEPKDLRSQAILNINTVFYNSGIVLACDRVLMSIDATPPISTRSYELMFAAIILCDWNMRAWTMLEALKGRSHVAILCRDNRVVPIHEVIMHIGERSQISLAVFTRLLPHVLPRSGNTSLIAENDVSLEMAGVWLSFRPASRPADYLTIWSLCLSQHQLRARSAAELWNQQRSVSPSFLMTNSERMRCSPGEEFGYLDQLGSASLHRKQSSFASRYRKSNKVFGRSWAPMTPFVLGERENDNVNGSTLARAFRNTNFVYESGDPVAILPQGLWGFWYAFEHSFGLVSRIRRAISPAGGGTDHILKPETVRQLRDIRHSLQVRAKYMTLLLPYRGGPRVLRSQESELVAVCQSDLEAIDRAAMNPHYTHQYQEDPWEWMGIYQWPSNVPLPAFRKTRVWIA